jgi:broad specificity phosphatase PhoE
MEYRMQKSSTRRVLAVIGAVFTAFASFMLAVIPAGAFTVTFVRHAESQANADGIIDTKVPGPGLTPLGQTQANAVAAVLNTQAHDGIYASTMVRTQQTATPYATLLAAPNPVTISADPYHPDYSKDIVVLNGLQEIGAGIFEGSSEDEGIGRIGYVLAPVAWSLGLRFVRIPGSEDGNEFDARVDAALDQIENDGQSDDPVVFSHGATIMFWTMMNVDNPDPTLLLTHQLDNTETVVVEKNDDGSWTLKNWGGEEIGPATLPIQLFVNTRDLIVAPQTALYNMRRPVLNLDAQGIAETGAQGVQDVAKATVKFATDTVTDIGNAVSGLGSATQTNATAANLTGKTRGATDLTAGNKVAPGSRVADAVARNNERINEAVQDVRNEINASIKKASDAVKKVADAAKDAAEGTKKDAA